MNTKILITVEGGVVQAVDSNNRNIEVRLWDIDKKEEEGKPTTAPKKIMDKYPYQVY